MSIRTPFWQAVSLRRAVCGFLVCLLLCGTLSACGKRPVHVDAPPDAENSTYPRIYPDSATDPSPQGK